MVVWFPGPQVDFLEDSEEGVAEVVEPEEAASNADRQMDLKKVGFSKGQCFAFSKWLNHRKVSLWFQSLNKCSKSLKENKFWHFSA